MGQAKQRGSFEQRQLQAVQRIGNEAIAQIEKRRAEEAALTPEERAHRKKASADARMFLAITAGAGLSLP